MLPPPETQNQFLFAAPRMPRKIEFSDCHEYQALGTDPSEQDSKKDQSLDHWKTVSCALLSGGGMKTGQAIGTTDRLGGKTDERPVHFQRGFATISPNIRLTAKKRNNKHLGGRPSFLTEGHQSTPKSSEI